MIRSARYRALEAQREVTWKQALWAIPFGIIIGVGFVWVLFP